MESITLSKYRTFIEKYYTKELTLAAQKGGRALNIDFSNVARFDPKLSEKLLSNPRESFEFIDAAIQEFDLGDIPYKLRGRVFNLPDSQKIKIRDLRSEHIGLLITADGLIRQASDVRPRVTVGTFECPKCSAQLRIDQMDSKLKEPASCNQCRHKGKFKLVDKKLTDVQQLIIEELSESLDGGEQPKRIRCILDSDLLEPSVERRRFPGNKIKVVGIVREIPISSKGGSQSTQFDIIIECNSVEGSEEEFEALKINESEEKLIKKLAKDPKIYEKLVNSIAPVIYGYTDIKESIALQLFGGVRKVKDDGTEWRGDIHILLMGDPGTGKSILLRYISNLAPKARYVAGKGASGAGLTAAVVKDEFLGGWALEAGTLVLANKGMACIDELDKISSEDRSAMHEAMEQQTVSISKANIQATLMSQTSVLAAANPKFGRFDPFRPAALQIDLPASLINRFDLFYLLRDIPNAENDKRVAKHVLALQGDIKSISSEIETKLLRKYIAYSKQNCFPSLGAAATKLIQDYYVKIRSSVSGEGIQSIPISARQLQAIVRLAEASARVRLSKKVTEADAQRAIRLVEETLKQLGTDPETGKIDIDRITTGITATTRNKMSIIRQIIESLESQFGKSVPKSEIVNEAENQGIEKSKSEEIIQNLLRSGDLFEPKSGFIQQS